MSTDYPHTAPADADGQRATILLIGAGGVVVHVHGEGGKVLGFSEHALAGMQLRQWIHPDEHDELNRRMNTAGFDDITPFSSLRLRNSQGQWEEVTAAFKRCAAAPDLSFLLLQSAAATNSDTVYAQIFQTHPDAMLLVDAEFGFFWDANEVATATYGYTPYELLGRPLHLMAPHWTDSLQKGRIVTDNVFQGEDEHRHRNGHIIHAEVTSQKLTRNGRTFWLSTVRDIGYRKESESRIAFLGSIIENAHDAIITVDNRGLVTSWNHAAARLAGITANQIIGHSLRSRFRFQLLPGGLRGVTSAVAQSHTWKGEVILLPHGRNTPLHLLVYVLDHKTSGPVNGYYQIFCRDISEQKRAETLLRESEDRFRKMADTAPTMIYMIDENDRPFYFNDAWLHFTGRSLEAEIAAPVDPDIHPDDAEWVKHKYFANTIARRPIDVTYRRRHHSGQWRWLTDRCVPRFLEDGTYIGYVGFCFDIHDRVEAEERRKKLEQELMQEKIDQQQRINAALIEGSERERSELSMELHDNVNQLLTSAKLYMELAAAQDGPHAPLALKATDQIMNAITEIRRLSHQLAPISLQQLGLAEAVEHHLAGLRHAGIRATFDCYPSALLRELNDVTQLAVYRIVQEQSNNILKYARATRLSIRLNRKDSRLLLTIEDNGVGFDPSRIKRGMGLTNIMSRAAMLGGSASFHSAPGQGCRLEVDVQLSGRRARI